MSAKLNKEMSFKSFLHHFKTNQNVMRKYCFILGSGASKQSGIRTGAELVKIWLTEIQERNNDEYNQFLNLNNISEKNQAEFYSSIYEERYKYDPSEGFAFLEKEMEGKEPSCGYSVLANILEKERHNIVITTNFDSLTEDSLFIYTKKKPLVIGHESLAGYIKPFLNRPIIIKIHRDLLLSPQNNVVGTNCLADNFQKNLNDIFKFYTPIVIGYGGNDGSLMDYLDKLDSIEGGIYWFYRNQNSLTERIKNLVDKFIGHFIKIDGFDEMMIQIMDKLEYKRLDGIIKNVAEIRSKTYLEQIEKIQKTSTTTTDTQKALDNIITKGEKDWWYYYSRAQKTKSLELKESIFKEGLEKLPNNSNLLGVYATFLHGEKKDYEEAQKFYKKSINSNPDDDITTGNYALFLHEILKDYEMAEKYYLKVLKINPKNEYNIGNYALFLSDIRKDYEKAEQYYLKSLELNPKDAYNLFNYTIFLDTIRNDYDKAEEYYKKTLEIDPNKLNCIQRYALFLKNIRKDYDNAEKYFRKSLEIDPNDEISLVNYAHFLHLIRKDNNKANEYYNKSITSNPYNATNFCDYAVFLYETLKNYEKAEEYFKKSIEINPNNANCLANYAVFLYNINQKYDKAEEYFKKSLDINPNNAINLGSYALFLNTIRKNNTESEKYYKKSINIATEDSNILGNYAKLLLEMNNLPEGKKFIDLSFQKFNQDQNKTIILELWFYRYAIFYKEYPQSEEEVTKLLNEDIRSEGWDLSKVIEIAEKHKHPDLNKLKQFAKQISSPRKIK